jgi:hypothetical protein
VSDLSLRKLASAHLVASALPAGIRTLDAVYLGSPLASGSTSAPLAHTVTPLDVGFIGGGVVFGQTTQCASVLGSTTHPVTVRYSPSELGGLPSGVSIVWRGGSEHLALWGPMAPSGQFFGGAGRGTWTRFVFYPTRPLIRVVDRRITAPPGAGLIDAQEMVLRLRVQNFAATPGCAVTLAAAVRRA